MEALSWGKDRSKLKTKIRNFILFNGTVLYCRRLLNLFEFRPVESIEMDFCELINKKSLIISHFKENSFCIVFAIIYQQLDLSTNVSCLLPYEL